MQVLNFLHSRVLAIAVAMAVVPAAIPSTVPIVGISKAEARDHGARHYRHGGYYRGDRFYRGGRHHRYRHYRQRHHNSGVGIGAAIIGLGIGAAIANSGPRYYQAPARGHVLRSREWYRSCAARYRSFDPRSGTYQPYNGPRRVCR